MDPKKCITECSMENTHQEKSAEGNENINSRADEKSCTQLEIWSSSTNTEKEQSWNDKEESHSGKKQGEGAE